jgi:hypothetical protein
MIEDAGFTIDSDHSLDSLLQQELNRPDEPDAKPEDLKTLEDLRAQLPQPARSAQ